MLETEKDKILTCTWNSDLHELSADSFSFLGSITDRSSYIYACSGGSNIFFGDQLR